MGDARSGGTEAGDLGVVEVHTVREPDVVAQPAEIVEVSDCRDEACEEPVRQIVRNCGTEGAVVVERIRTNHDPNFGFNASTEEYEDLVKGGVIDPTKVTRTALQNAASIASLMLTTEAMICAISDEPNTN